MKVEKFNLVVDRYTDDEGNHCCAKHFPDEVCIFYRTSHFGTSETCVFIDPLRESHLDRRNQGLGTLIPCSNCPIWYRNENI